MNNKDLHRTLYDIWNNISHKNSKNPMKNKDLQPTLINMMNAISHKNSIKDPEYKFLLGSEIIMEYIYDWAGGGLQDKDLLENLEITIRNTQTFIDKAEAQL